jgi:pilus assembly protein CpaB
MGRRTLLLIASILVAALGTALIWLYVQGADSRAEASTAQVEVLVATVPAPAGTAAKDVKWTRQAVPQSLVTSLGNSAITSPSQITGYTQSAIVPGLPLVSGQFAAKPAAPPPAVEGLGSEEIAMMVTLPDPQRLAGLLQPGTQIRVFASVETKGAKEKGVITLFDRVRVLTPAKSVEATPGANGTTAVPQASVLLALSPAQAKLLALSQFQAGSGSLWFGLLGQKVGDDDVSGPINSIVGG